MKPMNYQEALASGALKFWGKSAGMEWADASIWRLNEIEENKHKVIDWGIEFLLIPTAEQLLGAVEKSVWEYRLEDTNLSKALFADEFNNGDQVIIMRTPAPND